MPSLNTEVTVKQNVDLLKIFKKYCSQDRQGSYLCFYAYGGGQVFDENGDAVFSFDNPSKLHTFLQAEIEEYDDNDS